MRITKWAAIVLAITTAFLAACRGDSGPATGARLKIVATTGMIQDVAQVIAGDRARVTALMGPGVDPHLYKATQGDLARLTGSDIVFYNGLHLEGKMVDALEKLARTHYVISVSDRIPRDILRRPPEFKGNYDPHIWFDVELWTMAAQLIGDTLAVIDTAHAAEYHSRTAQYIHRLDSLHAWVASEIRTIPRTQRLLITAHDAFGYFGRAYDIEVRGLQGISTVSEFGLADINNLVETIVARKVKAVFIETSVPKRSIEAVVQGVKGRNHDVRIGGTLFSDAMGAAGTPEGTYIGMVTANVRTIVEALR